MVSIQASEVVSTSDVVSSDLGDEEVGGEAVITLAVAEPGARLDKWLASQLPARSRSEIQRWIEAGQVTVCGRSLKASYRLASGDEIAVVIPEPEDYAVEPEPIPLDVVYEDGDLLVVNKPAGMVVHPGAGNWHGTLVNAVLHHSPGLAGVGAARRPGIVHRLDKDTSGLILVAKNDAAHRALQVQFKDRAIQKTYLALVYGEVQPSRGEITAPIGRDPRQRHRMAVVSAAAGRPAVTRYETRGHYVAVAAGRPQTDRRFTLLACYPLTGRTHQIRVHLAHVRHPIVGDDTYGGRRRPLLACPRQFLHAHRLRFHLPATGELLEFVAELPEDLESVLATLAAV